MRTTSSTCGKCSSPTHVVNQSGLSRLMPPSANTFFDLLYSTFSALIYFAMIFVSSLIVSKWKKKDAIGGADLKLITICGLVLGILALPLFFLFSGLFGIVFGLAWQKIKKNEYFPFGPALIASFLFLIFYLS